LLTCRPLREGLYKVLGDVIEGNIAFWTGTETQLYDMFKPVIPIIRNNIPGAMIPTPPVSGGDATWMTNWMALEDANGRLSDYYGIHIYMEDNAPEQRLSMLQSMLKTKNAK